MHVSNAEQVTQNDLPSGHLVVALPRNFRVMALIFEGLVTFNCNDPRSIAVLRSECSDCSKPCRNRTGSVSCMLKLRPLPDASGLSSGMLLVTLLTRLLADCLPDDRLLSARAGRGPPIATEFLGLGLISSTTADRLLLLSDLIDDAKLLTEERGDVRLSGCCSGAAKFASMRERRKRFALSRGPASFSDKYVVVLDWRRRKRIGSGPVWAIWMRCGRRFRPWNSPRRARVGSKRCSGI